MTAQGEAVGPVRAGAARQDWIIILAILVLAIALRAWGISNRLPDATLGINPFDDSAIEETDRTTMGIAWSMWAGGTKPLDLNPHTGGWPGLSFYVSLSIQVLYRGYAELFLGAAGTAEFTRHVFTHPDRFFLFARVFGLALGVLTIWLTYRVGHRLVGRRPALIAAALLAVNPLHTRVSQHISDPNLLALLFTLLAVSAISEIGADSRLFVSAFAGAMIGLAGASKYVPLLLTIPLGIAHLHWWRSSRQEQTRAARNCIVALLAVCVAFAVASPYVLLDYRVAWGEIMTQATTLTSDWTGQTTLPLSLPTYLSGTLPSILGWPTLVLAVAGMVAFRGGARSLRVIPETVLVLILGNGLLRVAQERYLLPALPLLLIACGFSIDWIRRSLAPRVGVRAAGFASVVIIGAVAAQALLVTSTARSAHALPDTRHETRRWLNANIPPDRPLIVELYGPVVNTDVTERLAVAWPFFAAAPELVRAAYSPVFLDGFQYYVSSSEIRGRFERQSEKYPVEKAYYRWLAVHGRRIWSSNSVRATGPGIVVLELPAHVSSRAERDSLWRRALTAPMDRTRMSTWCWDLSQMFLLGQQDSRVEEWAERGLSIAGKDRQIGFLRTVAAARLNLRDFQGAAAASTKGLELLPNDAELHHYRGRALQFLGRELEAVVEYELSLRIDPTQRGRESIQAEIGRIRSRDRGLTPNRVKR